MMQDAPAIVGAFLHYSFIITRMIHMVHHAVSVNPASNV